MEVTMSYKVSVAFIVFIAQKLDNEIWIRFQEQLSFVGRLHAREKVSGWSSLGFRGRAVQVWARNICSRLIDSFVQEGISNRVAAIRAEGWDTIFDGLCLESTNVIDANSSTDFGPTCFFACTSTLDLLKFCNIWNEFGILVFSLLLSTWQIFKAWLSNSIEWASSHVIIVPMWRNRLARWPQVKSTCRFDLLWDWCLVH